MNARIIDMMVKDKMDEIDSMINLIEKCERLGQLGRIFEKLDSLYEELDHIIKK